MNSLPAQWELARQPSFQRSLKTFRELANIDAILMNPLKEPVPENAAAQYAVASALAHCSTDTNFDRTCTYIGHMPTEFSVLSVRNAPALRRRSATLLGTQSGRLRTITFWHNHLTFLN
jgi:hypothetical protein